jgi:hypothetical protein
MMLEDGLMLNVVEGVFCDVDEVFDYDVVDTGVGFDEFFNLECDDG